MRGASSVLLGLSLLWAVPARADEPRRLGIQIQGTCPTRALLAAELLPLVRGYELSDEAASLVVAVEDLGKNYKVSIGGASREIRDERRGCLERARVAAVFSALNLPESRPKAAPKQVPGSAAADRGEAASTAAEPGDSADRTSRALRLRGFAQVDTAPAAGATARGLGGGVSFSWRAASLGVWAAVTTPTTPFQPADEPAAFGLTRLPLALLLGYSRGLGILDLGLEAGPAVDVLRFEGQGVPHPETSLRLNPGVRLQALLRVRASRRLAAELMPMLSWFPRTYLVRVEPARTLAETPRWWLGASIGLSYAVWQE